MIWRIVNNCFTVLKCARVWPDIRFRPIRPLSKYPVPVRAKYRPDWTGFYVFFLWNYRFCWSCFYLKFILFGSLFYFRIFKNLEPPVIIFNSWLTLWPFQSVRLQLYSWIWETISWTIWGFLDTLRYNSRGSPKCACLIWARVHKLVNIRL